MRKRRSLVSRKRMHRGGFVRIVGPTTWPIVRNLLSRWEWRTTRCSRADGGKREGGRIA